LREKREPLSDERSEEFRFASRNGEEFSERFDSLDFLLLFGQVKRRVRSLLGREIRKRPHLRYDGLRDR
jgi:hypothetical protein